MIARAKKPSWTASKQADLATLFGVSVDTIGLWRKKGMPGKPGQYDIAQIIAWLRSDGPWKERRAATDDDDLTGPSDSPGLERYRLAKAKLAELELAKQKRSVMSRDMARETLGRIASLFRRYGERLSKRHGPEEAVLFNEALGEAHRVIVQEFGDEAAE